MNIRLVKAFFFGLAGLAGFALLLSLLIPSQVHVVRNLMVSNVATSQVVNNVGNLREWSKWHPAFKGDSIKQLLVSDSQLHIQKGNQQIELIRIAQTDTSCTIKMSIPGEPLFVHEISWQNLAKPGESLGAVNIAWHAEARLKWYPWQKFYGIFLDKITAPGYEQALQALSEWLITNR
jgi:hypothetical protein